MSAAGMLEGVLVLSLPYLVLGGFFILFLKEQRQIQNPNWPKEAHLKGAYEIVFIKQVRTFAEKIR